MLNEAILVQFKRNKMYLVNNPFSSSNDIKEF